MHLRDLIPKGPTVTPKQPAYGIYNNILLGDKHRGIEPAAVAPMGKLTMTGDSDMFVMLQGVCPAMFMPMTAKSNVGRGSNMGNMAEAEAEAEGKFTEDWEDMRTLLHELVEGQPYWRWKIHPLAADYRTANLPTDAFHTPNEQHVLRDYLNRYQIFNMSDYTWWMTAVQDSITRFRVASSAIETRPIGLSVLLDKTKDNSRGIYRPREHISFRDKMALRMMVPREDYVMRHKREAYKWQLMAAVSAHELAHALPERLWKLDHYDYLAYAAYTIGALSGFHTSIDDSVRYTAEDVLQDTLSYLALPFADAWPDISVPEDQDKKTLDVLKWLWMYNTSLAMGGKRVGGKVVNVDYLLEAGNIHLVKSIMPMYLKSPMNLGGGDTMWMPPAVNTSVPFGVFFPSPVYPGTNKWEPNVEEKFDAFSDLQCDRGRMDLPDLDALSGNYRVIMSRDSLVRTVTERGVNYGIIVHKIQPNGFRRATACAEETLLSYISDPTMKFGPAVFVSSSMNRSRHEVTMGPTPIIDGKYKPMPGGLIDNDAGTKIAEAQPTSAPSAVVVGERSSIKIPVPTVTGDVAVVEAASQDQAAQIAKEEKHARL